MLDAGNAVTAPRPSAALASSAPSPRPHRSPGSTGIGTSTTLHWWASIGATGYEYCLVVGVTTPCTTWTSAGNATSVSLTGL